MADLNDDGAFTRLRKLPYQLLLAVINGTAILVIIAAILALVATARIEHFAGNIGATMTDAVLSKIDLPSKDVLANIQKLREEIRTLGDALQDIRTGENPILQSEIARLRDSLSAVRVSVDRLRDSRSILTDQAAARFGDAVTKTLVNLRDCSPDGSQNGLRNLRSDSQ